MKTMLAVVLVGLVVSAFADGRFIDLAKVANPVLSAHVDGKPSAPTEGTSVAVTEKGVRLDCNFTSARHDASMFAFVTEQAAFEEMDVDFTITDGRQLVYAVLVDANGENHCFKCEAVNSNVRTTRTLKVKEKNDHPAEYFAWRWGGDDNQRIDWPVKKIFLGVNDTPDTFTGRVSVVIHKLTLR